VEILHGSAALGGRRTEGDEARHPGLRAVFLFVDGDFSDIYVSPDFPFAMQTIRELVRGIDHGTGFAIRGLCGPTLHARRVRALYRQAPDFDSLATG
jgi:hypothetical protein